MTDTTCARPSAPTPAEAVEIMRPCAHLYASRHSRHDASLYDDLLQEGLMGAVVAARTFDPTRGLKFSTYAEHRVRGRIVDHIRDLDHLSRDHRRELGDAAPSVHGFGRLTSGWRDNGDQSASVAFGRESHNLQPALYDPEHRDDPAAEFAAVVRTLDPGLTSVQRDVLRLYHCDGLKMWEIGQQMDMSESRVSQIHSEAVARLRGASRTRVDAAHDLAAPCRRQERLNSTTTVRMQS